MLAAREMLNWAEAKAELGRGVAAGQGRIRRVEAEVGPVDVLGWLAATVGEEKFFWADRDGRETVAGCGAAWRGENSDTALEEIQTILADAPRGVRCWGGMAFDPSRKDALWHAFDVRRFVVPRFELVRRDGRTVLACQMRAQESLEEVLSEIAALPEVIPSLMPDVLPQALTQQYEPASLWCARAAEVIEALRRGDYAKVVLARRREMVFPEPLNPWALMARLRPAARGCYRFLFQTGGRVFFGASPERLFRRDGQDFWSEAVAGTRPRGATEEDDQLLAEELRQSIKDAEEHRLVAEHIARRLQPLCAELDQDAAPAVTRLSGSHHLTTRFQGRLQPGITDARITAALHPTPAVAGLPTDKALEVIRGFEPFARGWYAGPVGYVGAASTEFAVAIRSGLIHAHKLYLFAGAGLVSLSDPSAEWDEIEHKLGSILRAAV